MTDLVDRQAAIDAIRASASKYTGFMEMEMYTDDDAVEAINGVPSTEPVRHGKWIVTNEGVIKCSECKRKFILLKENYCPNCGCRMDAEWQNVSWSILLNS